MLPERLDNFFRRLNAGTHYPQINRRTFLRGFIAAAGALALAPRFSPPASAATGRPQVEAGAGRIRGFNSQGIHVFKGIPYGMATGGKNRFMPPVKPTPWQGVRDALDWGAGSPGLFLPGQVTPPWMQFYWNPDLPQSEDCLNLNVWTPGVDDHTKRPVLFWIHGGGFTVGSSAAPSFDGENMARRNDVVVVSVNHRLNIFGYLDLGSVLGDEFARAGNAGQLDLIAALEWVRQNIERFGGDPGSVTVFGNSGGGFKICALLAMPAAKGLFHRAVIQSGPLLRMTDRARTQAAAVAFLQALELSPQNARNKLHKFSTEELMTAAARIAPEYGRGLAPVLDGEDIPRQSFDPDAPGVSADVPLMIGYTRTELTLFAADPAQKDQEFGFDDSGLRQHLQPLLNGGDIDKVIAIYRDAYPAATPSDLYYYITTDSGMGRHSILIAERKAALGRAPAFLYRFDWETPYEGGYLKSPHTAEIPFVFNNMALPIVQASFGADRGTLELGRKVSGTWAAFARTGSPNRKQMPRWPAYNGATRPTMLIDHSSKVEYDPVKEGRKVFANMPIRNL